MGILLADTDRRLTRRTTNIRPDFLTLLEEVVEGRLVLVAAMFALLGVELVWTELSDVSVVGSGFALSEILTFIAAGVLGQIAGRHGAANGWQSSRLVVRVAEFITNLGFYCLFCFAILFLSYLCARSTLPLHDARLAAADAVIGFHWLDWWSYVQHHPRLDQVLTLAYYSLKVQVVVTCLVMAFCSDRLRALEFFWLALGTAVIACAISGILPAMGAAPYFHVSGSPWLGDLKLLRGPEPVVFEFTRLQGIVTFPSYHAVLAVLLTWANRRMGAITVAFAALNIMMLVSAPTVGGHHLVDVIAGVLLGLVAVVIAARVRWTPLSLAQALG